MAQAQLVLLALKIGQSAACAGGIVDRHDGRESIFDSSWSLGARLVCVTDEERKGIWTVSSPESPARMECALSSWSGPSPIMREALALLQRDLDETGLSEFRIGLLPCGYAPGEDGELTVVKVAVELVGRSGFDDISDGIVLGATTVDELVPSIARSVGYSLVASTEPIYWPICPEHDRRMTATEDDQPPAWRCAPKGEPSHVVVAIGQLASIRKQYSAKRPVWTGLRRG